MHFSSLLFPFLPLLPLLPLLIPFTSAQTMLECPNEDLTAYLLQLIDALYANGLTTFGSLLAEITSHESGYQLLSSIFTSTTITTILVPTDSALQSAGIWAPFGDQSPEYLVDLFGLHSLQGHYGYNELPSDGLEVVKSLMRVDKTIPQNGTGTGGGGGWQENIVLRKGMEGKLVVKTALGDIGTWSGPAHLDGYDLLDNIVLLPVDHIIPSPPNISTALTLPTTTRSPNGLTNLALAISNVSETGADALAQMTSGGLTFFAPVDDAWTEGSWAQVTDKDVRAKLVGNHYTTNYTLFSQEWSAKPEGSTITIMTGEKISVVLEGGDSFITLGDQKAQILRSDIALENGVLHIIDKVLLVSEASKTNSITPTIGTTPSGAGSPSGKSGQTPSGAASGAATPSRTSYASPHLVKVSTAYWITLAGLMVWYVAGL